MLQIRLLGQFNLQLDRKRITIPSRIGQSLFAYLVMTTGTPHRREKLAGTFWPDTTEESARRSLRQELWRIRKALATGQNSAGDTLVADEYVAHRDPDVVARTIEVAAAARGEVSHHDHQDARVRAGEHAHGVEESSDKHHQAISKARRPQQPRERAAVVPVPHATCWTA